MTVEKLNDIWEALSVWDKVEALEFLGIKLDLTDEEQISIASEKAAEEKKEELKDAKENKIRTAEFIANMNSGVDYKKALEKLFIKKN